VSSSSRKMGCRTPWNSCGNVALWISHRMLRTRGEQTQKGKENTKKPVQMRVSASLWNGIPNSFEFLRRHEWHFEYHTGWSNRAGEKGGKLKKTGKTGADEGEFVFLKNGMQNSFEFLRGHEAHFVTHCCFQVQFHVHVWV